MTDLTKIYIDLSKCTEEEIKSLPQILKKAGEKLSTNFQRCVDKEFEYLKFRFDNGINAWCASGFKGNRTELSYPEFIKLFEGGEGENNGWIKIESEADLPKESYNYWVMQSDGLVQTLKEYEQNKQYWKITATHYQPIVKPEPPKF